MGLRISTGLGPFRVSVGDRGVRTGLRVGPLYYSRTSRYRPPRPRPPQQAPRGQVGAAFVGLLLAGICLAGIVLALVGCSSSPAAPAPAPSVAPSVGVSLAPSQEPSPAPSASPVGFLCSDGTRSYAEHRQGACSHHGGIAG